MSYPALSKWLGGDLGTELTPVIGQEFSKEHDLTDLWKSENKAELLKDLSKLISERGVVVFKQQDNFDRSYIGDFLLELGEAAGKPKDHGLHIHPVVQAKKSDGVVEELQTISNQYGINAKDRDAVERYWGGRRPVWHSDISFEPVPALYTLLRIHTKPATGGDTLFLSTERVYEKLSPTLQKLADRLTATHSSRELFTRSAAALGQELYTDVRGAKENVGPSLTATHPLVRINPTTGRKALFVNPTFTKSINELSEEESAHLLDYFFRLEIESHDAQVRHHWTKHDVVIWDNRSTLHAATHDIKEVRIGDRGVVLGEKPIPVPFEEEKQKEKEKVKVDKPNGLAQAPTPVAVQ